MAVASNYLSVWSTNIKLDFPGHFHACCSAKQTRLVFFLMPMSTTLIGWLSARVTGMQPFPGFNSWKGVILFSLSTLWTTVDSAGVVGTLGFTLTQRCLPCYLDCSGVVYFLRWFGINNNKQTTGIRGFSAHNISWSTDIYNTLQVTHLFLCNVKRTHINTVW